jgi:hypothetical protein
VTINDAKLTDTMLPTLRRVAGADMVSEQPLVTAAEDFSIFAQRAPGLFVFLGATRKGVDPATAPANHSPLFDVDEGVLPLGVRTLAHLAADYFHRSRTNISRRLADGGQHITNHASLVAGRFPGSARPHHIVGQPRLRPARLAAPSGGPNQRYADVEMRRQPGQATARHLEQQAMMAGVDDLRRRAVDDGFETVRDLSRRPASRPSFHNCHHHRAKKCGAIERSLQVHGVAADARIDLSAVADDDSGRRRIALTTHVEKSIAHGERGVGDQEIEITGVHFARRGASVTPSNGLEVIVREPLVDGRTHNIGRHHGGNGHVRVVTRVHSMPAKTFRILPGESF